jgi:hypothetical protein
LESVMKLPKESSSNDLVVGVLKRSTVTPVLDRMPAGRGDQTRLDRTSLVWRSGRIASQGTEGGWMLESGLPIGGRSDTFLTLCAAGCPLRVGDWARDRMCR